MTQRSSANPQDDNGSATSREGSHLAGKYMTFKLGGEEYGLEILKVRELIQLMEITRVPRTSDDVRGVINLRGKVIPVIDLKMRFGMGKLEETDHTVIIVLQYQAEERSISMGVLVDEVLEVIDLQPGQVEPKPDFGASDVESAFILGVGKQDGRVILLLDIGKVLLGGESAQLAALSETESTPHGR